MRPRPAQLLRILTLAAATLGASVGFLVGAGVARAEGDPAVTTTPATNPVVIPFDLRRGRLMVPARVNGAEPTPFMLDTGYGMTMLRPGQAEEFSLRRTGRVTIVGIAGEEPAGVFEGPRLDFGGTVWRPRRVGAFPAGDERRARQRHGILGSGFFRRFVVEINPKSKTVVLHEPAAFQYAGPGEVLPLRFKETTPIVQATVRRGDRSTAPAQFEIDTGCESCLCVGRPFAEEHGLFPGEDAPSEGRRGVGGTTRTRPGRVLQLQLGGLSLTNVSADVFVEGSPAEAPVAGHIGFELLRAYRVFFDYSRARMILENHP